MKSVNYKKSIVIFGLILPLTLLVVAFVMFSRYKSNFDKTYKEREEMHSFIQRNQASIKQTKAEIKPYEPYQEQWSDSLGEEVAFQINTVLSDLKYKYDETEFRQTSFSVSSTTSKYSKTLSIGSSKVTLTFQGNYYTMQKALIELESQLPHYHLDKLNISKQPTDDFLKFELNYTVWRK